MKKRTISLLCCVAIVGSLFVGCGSKTTSESAVTDSQSSQAAEETTASTETVKQNVTLTVAANQGSLRDIDKTLAEKSKNETGITIDFQVIPMDQYDNVIKSKLAVGEGTDIFLGDSGMQMAKYNPEQYLLDLSNEPWVSRYTDGAKKATSYNGKVYGLNIWASDVWAMMYDSKLFEKLNLKVPTNFDEFVAVCDTLKKNDITPIYENGKDTWHMPGYFKNTGAAVEKANPGAFAAINSNEKKFGDYPEFEQVFARLKLLSDKGYFSKNVLSETWGDGTAAAEALASGKYGMVLVWSSFCNDIVAKHPEAGPLDRWKMFNSPLYGDCTIAESSTGGVTHYVSKASKNIEAVKTHFNWLVKPENLAGFYEGRPDLAAIKPFKDLANMPTNPALDSYLALGKNTVLANLENDVNYINGDLIGKSMQDVLVGAKTPKQAIEAIDADRIKTIKAIQK